MNIDVLVGCQYGSEAKGLVASKIAQMRDYDWLVSVNSSQAGHTAYYHRNEDNEPVKVVTRQLPASCITNHEAQIYIGAGAVINPTVLKNEIHFIENELNIPIKERLFISEYATVITEDNIQEEIRMSLGKHIGSTCEGVGSALSGRATRRAYVMAEVSGEVSKKIGGGVTFTSTQFVTHFLRGEIFLEGSQGFGLSSFYDCYPFCTSRDTTTAAFLSYAQLPPTKVRDVYGVYRTFPIRVGGNSGYMYNELEWADVAQISGYDELSEYTTVTGRLRRVSEWDARLARHATVVNGVTKPIITFLNYLDKEIEGKTSFNDLPKHVLDQIKIISESISIPIYALSTHRCGGWIFDI